MMMGELSFSCSTGIMIRPDTSPGPPGANGITRVMALPGVCASTALDSDTTTAAAATRPITHIFIMYISPSPANGMAPTTSKQAGCVNM